MPRYRAKSWRDYRPDAVPAPSVIAVNLNSSCRILGIDPGSRLTGFGVIEVEGAMLRCIAHGRIDVSALPLTQRLSRIYAGIRQIVEQHLPQEVAVERVFVSRNVESALKLGQARGAALAALDPEIPCAEYAPRAVKLATVGFGGADKLQIVHMMRQMLQIDSPLSADAADALAVALCHAQHRKLAALIGSAG